MKRSTLEETSAGGVVYRQRDGKFLLGKHSGYHKWVLPKGLVEKGESYTEAGEREVWEETGVKARVTSQTPLKVVEYWYQADMDEIKKQNPHTVESVRRVKQYQEAGGGRVKVHKKVYFYPMELVEEVEEHGWEMEEKKWVSYEEGIKILAFESEREVLAEANKVISASDQN